MQKSNESVGEKFDRLISAEGNFLSFLEKLINACSFRDHFNSLQFSQSKSFEISTFSLKLLREIERSLKLCATRLVTRPDNVSLFRKSVPINHESTGEGRKIAGKIMSECFTSIKKCLTWKYLS